jgi:hypothetical protein
MLDDQNYNKNGIGIKFLAIQYYDLYLLNLLIF